MGNMGRQSPSEFHAEKSAVYLLPLEPISETDIFVCASGMTDRIKRKKVLIPQSIVAANIKKFQPVVTEIWVRMDTQDQLLDSPLVTGPVVNNYEKNLIHRIRVGNQAY